MLLFTLFSEQVIIDNIESGKCNDLHAIFKEAVSGNKISIVTHLLKKSWERFAPLDDDVQLKIVRENYVEIFELLRNANILRFDMYSFIPELPIPGMPYNMLQYASFLGHIEIVGILLNHGVIDPGANRNNAIQLASRKGHCAIVNLLLGHGKVDPSDWDNYAIRLAIDNNHLDVVRLLASKIDISTLPNEYREKILIMGLSKKDIVESNKSIKEKIKQLIDESDPQMRIEEQNGKKYACFIFEL